MLIRYIINQRERKKILFACHVDETSGHMGVTRTLARIKERYMWHGMVKDVKEMVSRFAYICPCILVHIIVKFNTYNYWDVNLVLYYCYTYMYTKSQTGTPSLNIYVFIL